MILLSENGKTFVKISSWDDIITRPGYVEKIDPTSVKLKQILGRYNISPQQPCGIKNCGTAHNMGFLVLCEGGLETNIGRHCGKNIFGVDFQRLERVFTQDTNAQRYRQNISTFKNAIQNFIPQIEFLKFGEKQSLYCIEKMHYQATKGFEQKTLDRLLERAKRNDGYIMRTIALVGDERRIAIEAQSPLYREEFLTTINGLNSLLAYKTLKALVSVTFDIDLKIFLEIKEDFLDFNSLKHWNNWVNTFEVKLKKAEDIVIDCNRFLEPSNRENIISYKHLL